MWRVVKIVEQPFKARLFDVQRDFYLSDDLQIVHISSYIKGWWLWKKVVIVLVIESKNGNFNSSDHEIRKEIGLFS